jgi:hypothetical protein
MSMIVLHEPCESMIVLHEPCESMIDNGPTENKIKFPLIN